MKILFSITLLLTVGLISCGTSKPLTGTLGGSVTDEIKQANITDGEVVLKLYSKDKLDTVVSSIEYMFYTDPQLPYQDSINRIIKMYVFGTVSGFGITEQNADLSVESMEEAINMFGDEYNQQLNFVEDGVIWTTETSISIIEHKSDYVEVSLSNWGYSGGAHGNSNSEERIFDIKTGRELKLIDFITNIDELNSIAEAIFRADQEIPTDKNLVDAGFWFEDGIFRLNENFTFNEESLDFLYNKYEIAPYVAGTIFISIPRNKIKHLIKRKVD